MRYENFDLRLDRADSTYRARVIHSLAGEAFVTFDKLPAGRSPAPAASSPELDAAQIGGALYAAAFGGGVDLCFRRSLDEAARGGLGLRVRIRIDSDALGRTAAWELAALPWEYLYQAGLDRFVALSPSTPVVRYIELPDRAQPLTVQPPLKVLVASASPQDQVGLEVEQEWALLKEAVAPMQGAVSLERLDAATLDKINGRLNAGPVHLLHFLGHGWFDDASGEGGLVLDDGTGFSKFVPGGDFATLLSGRPDLRMVFLAACQGGQTASVRPFGGVAQQLVQQGVPVVIAMQAVVSEAGSRALSTALYRGLALGMPVDAALGDARRLMASQGEPFEWGTPVLFSRSDDLQLLVVPQAVEPPMFEPKRFEPLTVVVPAGTFLMGSATAPAGSNEAPQHLVTLPAYRIGVYPVTVSQYAEYVLRAKADPPQGWLGPRPNGKFDHPVSGIKWYDAVAYCRWLSEETGRRYRLPTEAEWERAARGTDGRIYPWGNAWVDSACQVEAPGTAPVTAHPTGVSPAGCHDMLGNVLEWTNTAWGRDKASVDYVYPYRADDGREDPAPPLPAPQLWRVHRGGSYKSLARDVRCTVRSAAPPDWRVDWRGFRVALDL